MRLIDADALMETIKSNDYMLVDICNTKDFGMYTIGIQQAVDEQSTIEPIAPRGHWTINTDDFTPAWRCSNCGYSKPILAGERAKQEPKSFCQSCGADMRGDHD